MSEGTYVQQCEIDQVVDGGQYSQLVVKKLCETVSVGNGSSETTHVQHTEIEKLVQ